MIRSFFQITIGFSLLVAYSCRQAFSDGEKVYSTRCQSCHMQEGDGLGKLYPDLRNSALIKDRIYELPCFIVKGKQSSIMANIQMPPVYLSETQMLNLVNYLNYSWGKKESLMMDSLRNNYKECVKQL